MTFERLELAYNSLAHCKCTLSLAVGCPTLALKHLTECWGSISICTLNLSLCSSFVAWALLLLVALSILLYCIFTVYGCAANCHPISTTNFFYARFRCSYNSWCYVLICMFLTLMWASFRFHFLTPLQYPLSCVMAGASTSLMHLTDEACSIQKYTA
jgi:hypothetical protein